MFQSKKTKAMLAYIDLAEDKLQEIDALQDAALDNECKLVEARSNIHYLNQRLEEQEDLIKGLYAYLEVKPVIYDDALDEMEVIKLSEKERQSVKDKGYFYDWEDE